MPRHETQGSQSLRYLNCAVTEKCNNLLFYKESAETFGKCYIRNKNMYLNCSF